MLRFFHWRYQWTRLVVLPSITEHLYSWEASLTSNSLRHVHGLRRWTHSRKFLSQDTAATTLQPTISSETLNFFETAWSHIREKFGKNLTIPREIIWLNGAPGAGKGANTPFILRSRGLSRAITVSDLLAVTPEAHAYMTKGELIPEGVVFGTLLSHIFHPNQNNGIGMIVDGYPRTDIQVDSLKLLYDKLKQLHLERQKATPDSVLPKPTFKVVLLYVDEETSIQRQLSRGKAQSQKIQRAHDAGTNDPQLVGNVRSTDLSVEHCKKRYAIFKAHYGTMLRLKRFFPFHLIDAIGTLDDTRRQISRELRYQSSTDLEAVTYDAIRHLPMAKELVKLSRQALTARLDTYAILHSATFKKVITIIDQEVLPILKRSGMTGEAVFTTDHSLFSSQPIAVDILIDVLSDRGFHVSYIPDVTRIPVKIDKQTGDIYHQTFVAHGFKIRFAVQSVRDVGEEEETFRWWDMSNGKSAESEICNSFMPEGTDHQDRYKNHETKEDFQARWLKNQEKRKEDIPDDAMIK